MEATIRDARESDVPFIAWVQQEAARSHLPVGFWDLAFPGAEADRLRIIGRIASAGARSFCHWSRFLVAEVDGRPVAALCGYDRQSVAAGSDLVEAMGEALATERWEDARTAAMQTRISPFLTCVPDTDDATWVVEWVATRPEHRGRGLIRSLLREVVRRGTESGHDLAQIAVLIGNTPAQRAYEGAGFRVVDEKRHPDFEAALGCPGIRRLLRRPGDR